MLKLGLKKLVNKLQPFDIELQPFIEEIDAKVAVIREYADAATMEGIKGTLLPIYSINILRANLTKTAQNRYLEYSYSILQLYKGYF